MIFHFGNHNRLINNNIKKFHIQVIQVKPVFVGVINLNSSIISIQMLNANRLLQYHHMLIVLFTPLTFQRTDENILQERHGQYLRVTNISLINRTFHQINTSFFLTQKEHKKYVYTKHSSEFWGYDFTCVIDIVYILGMFLTTISQSICRNIWFCDLYNSRQQPSSCTNFETLLIPTIFHFSYSR